MREFLKTLKNNDDFSTGWKKLRSQATLDDLLWVIPNGEHKGKTALWFLAYAIDPDCVKDLQRILKGLPLEMSIREQVSSFFRGKGVPVTDRKLTLDDLLAEAQTGEDAGISVLWLLSELALNDIPEPFMTAWEAFKTQLKLKDFLRAPSAGPSKGYTVISTLGHALAFGVAEPFNAFWEQYKTQISKKMLIEGGDKSLLWRLIQIAKKVPGPFLWIWDRYGKQIPLNVLLKSYNGKSMFRHLAYIADRNAEPFMQVYAQYKGELTLEHLLAEPDLGSQKGQSVLFLLTYAAFDDPWLFNTVWAQLKTQITLKDLLKEDSSTGQTPLEQLAYGAMKRRYSGADLLVKIIIKDILNEMPGVIRHENTRNALCKINPPWIETRIDARNQFFAEFERVKAGEPFDQTRLFYLAGDGKGYNNGFYELGLHFQSKGQHDLARTCFERVGPFSTHYQAVREQLVEEQFSKLSAETEEQALDNIFSLSDSDKRKSYLDKAASFHVYGDTEHTQAVSLPETILASLEKDKNAAGLIQLFELTKKTTTLKEKNEKSVSRSKIKRPLNA